MESFGDRSRIARGLAIIALDTSADLFTLTEKVCTCNFGLLFENLIGTIAHIIKYSLSLMIIWIVFWVRLSLVLVNRIQFTANLVVKVADMLNELFWKGITSILPVLDKAQAPAGSLRVSSKANLYDLLTIIESEADVYTGCSVLMDCANLGSLQETIQAVKHAIRVSPNIVWHFHCDPERLDVFKTITILVGFGLIRFKDSQCELVIHKRSHERIIKALTEGCKPDMKLKRRLSDPCLLTKSSKVVGTDTPSLEVRESFRM